MDVLILAIFKFYIFVTEIHAEGVQAPEGVGSILIEKAFTNAPS
jgi:hypothetical protein